MMEWISVEDGLPKIRDIFLVRTIDGQIAFGKYECMTKQLWHVQPYCSAGYATRNGITHWMPLPEPPEPESTDMPKSMAELKQIIREEIAEMLNLMKRVMHSD